MKDNKLIAEFMGFTNDETNNLGVIWYDNEETYLMISSRFENSNCFDENQLNFHKSWDWLMPVVEKIESLGYNIHIRDCDCVIYNWTDKSTDKLLNIESGKGKRDSTYKAVVEFIKYYNKTK